MIFQQIFDPISYTYTYLCADPISGKAILIDPVITHTDQWVDRLGALNLTMIGILDTHVHADHITGALSLREKTKASIYGSALDQLAGVDVYLNDQQTIPIADKLYLTALATPGHTRGHMAFKMQDRIFTGDALLINGCGRTDFQQGDAKTLYESIHRVILTQQPDTLIFPGHDYHGQTHSTVAEQLKLNPRVQLDQAAFIDYMNHLNLAKPAYIDWALPANEQLGAIYSQTIPQILYRPVLWQPIYPKN